MMILRVKLKFDVIKTLMKELNQSEMWAIYLMGLGKELPDKVTKVDLIQIIHLLCKKLDWVDEEDERIEEERTNDCLENQDEKINPNSIIINNRSQQTDGCCESRSIKIEEDQRHSGTADYQTKVDISINKNVDINKEMEVSSTAKEIPGPSEESNKCAIEEASNTITKHVENQAAEGNIYVPKDNAKELPFSCNICPQRFSTERYLAAHAYMNHEDMENQVSFSCSICNKKFTIREELNTHEMSHSENKIFSSSQELSAHERIHTGEGLGNLKTQKITCTQDKPYKCSHCDKAFIEKVNLEIHERVHNDCKDFNNSRRDKKLSSATKLHHRKKENTSNVCCYCEKSFNTPSKLKRHERIHTGDKPYQCSHCDKAFTQAGTLKLHLRMHIP